MKDTPIVRQVRHDINAKPFIAIWEVTRACQLVCQHCRADAQHEPAPGQLTTAEGKALLDSIATYDKPRPIVVLTGGDPFERGDLEELTEYGTSLGLNISLSPSVTPRLTRARLEGLKAVGGSALSLSLDGATAATHDYFRGFSGTFVRTVEMAEIVTDVGFRLQINSTITSNNVKEAPALLKRVIDMGAKLWSVFFLVPTGRGTGLGALSPLEREDAMNWLHDVSNRVAIKTTEGPQYRRIVIQRSKGQPYEGGELYKFLTEETERLLGPAEHTRRPRPPMAINAGSGFVFIDHLGDVYPNGFLPMHCGNVKEQTLPDIYATSPVFKKLRDPQQWSGKCSVCEFASVCGGSRSTAFAMTGDPLASDPTCAYVPQAWKELHAAS
ncbi:radical SAM protein [Corynebacterium sp. HMSC077D10]|uniref:Radical SAM/SPASM domain-containing protein n=1 Tax=Corynebacterium phoceense TaxID=1686286 RepID=A0A540RB15_9CORY|nr:MULTISPECIES: TIGR04053 family radical SAM/SPASM domain-containing protein [Corynebacterium]KXB56005.1 radical SAM domain protein [Corynebacterium sp. DNF00584]OFL78753.1 radical SAM protein [Corynebacterium sp. HMSC077B05]OFP21017.1 radical SAM protein [Corynebacterium sp. HMSC065A05]OFP69424.1 radical SAM protein [Corynebacterium sp. HMSC077D10]TQE44604.1 radical SAM/SPASM domain-containing protein [Corynebacterium phoceense]